MNLLSSSPGSALGVSVYFDPRNLSSAEMYRPLRTSVDIPSPSLTIPSNTGAGHSLPTGAKGPMISGRLRAEHTKSILDRMPPGSYIRTKSLHPYPTLERRCFPFALYRKSLAAFGQVVRDGEVELHADAVEDQADSGGEKCCAGIHRGDQPDTQQRVRGLHRKLS